MCRNQFSDFKGLALRWPAGVWLDLKLDSVYGSEIPNNHRLDVFEAMKIMGEPTRSNWLAIFQPSRVFYLAT